VVCFHDDRTVSIVLFVLNGNPTGRRCWPLLVTALALPLGLWLAQYILQRLIGL